ncbi:MAG: alpha/beta hydrolase [Alphaproteobacteria bacterium]|nr:MAG: alpha/beta hydrolase [Alphaproteobacteria bacterium]
MTLDPQVQWVLDVAKEKGLPELNELSADEAKAVYEERAKTLSLKDIDIGKSIDVAIPGPHGDIPARIYQPIGMEGALPVLIYYHGGGWVIGSPDTHDGLCRMIANDGPFVVISVDYRMGPEHRFPAAVDDAYAALNWTVDNIADFGGDTEKIAVGGDSAGGNLSAVVCLVAREEGSYMPRFQWLIYPATDMRMNAPSHNAYGEGYFLTKPLMQWFRGHYLNDDADQLDWRASPLLAESLKDLPPALIQTAGYDPLQDEGKAYAERLNEEGGAASYTHYSGMIHGFINLGGAIDEAKTCIKEGVEALRKAFA